MLNVHATDRADSTAASAQRPAFENFGGERVFTDHASASMTLSLVGETPRHRWYVPVKLAAEWSLALVLLVLTAPLVLVIALAVKLTSPGPVFYSQTRLGRHGKPYRIVKIRTMTHNCEAKTGAVWAAKNDVRITKVGKILRETHLDEVPQLWNVLKGDMALIGPRPERPEIVPKLERSIPDYRGRLAVRPGVTGLAQMQLPADADLEDVRRKVAYDLYYVRHMSPLMDVRISISTAFYFLGAGADAIRHLAVKSHGSAVERDMLHRVRFVPQVQDECRVGVA